MADAPDTQRRLAVDYGPAPLPVSPWMPVLDNLAKIWGPIVFICAASYWLMVYEVPAQRVAAQADAAAQRERFFSTLAEQRRDFLDTQKQTLERSEKTDARFVSALEALQKASVETTIELKRLREVVEKK